MKAYYIVVRAFDEASVVAAESASKAKALTADSLIESHGYTFKEAVTQMSCHRSKKYDKWAEKQTEPKLVGEYYLRRTGGY